MNAPAELVVIESNPATGDLPGPETITDCYEFAVNLAHVDSEDAPEPNSPLFRASQIDAMNAFGEATERDAFE